MAGSAGREVGGGFGLKMGGGCRGGPVAPPRLPGTSVERWMGAWRRSSPRAPRILANCGSRQS
jgi:hypothetical protein